MIRAISVNSCLQQWDLISNSSGKEKFPGSPPNVGFVVFVHYYAPRGFFSVAATPFCFSLTKMNI